MAFSVHIRSLVDGREQAFDKVVHYNDDDELEYIKTNAQASLRHAASTSHDTLGFRPTIFVLEDGSGKEIFRLTSDK